MRLECGVAGEKHVDERGVNEQLERLRGIESLELLLGRRRVDQLPVHGLCRRCRGRQRQFEAAAKKRNAGRMILRYRVTYGKSISSRSEEPRKLSHIFFLKKGGHMVGFISNLAPLLNYSLVTISLPPSSALLKPESLREG